MANSTVNNAPDGFDDAVTALRQIMRYDGTVGNLCAISLKHSRAEGWQVKAQSSGSRVEREAIDTLCGWARALDGDMTLSDARVTDYGFERSHWRSLTVTATVAGIAVEIWDHVDRYTTTDTESAPELVTA
jgi:hypothetical protein